MEDLSDFVTGFTVVKKESPVIITINGEQVRMPSGKSAWKNMRAAKLAFGAGLKKLLWERARTPEDYWRRDPNNLYNRASRYGWTKLRDDLVEAGIIEFKQ